MIRLINAGVSVFCGVLLTITSSLAQEAGSPKKPCDFVSFHHIDKAWSVSRGEGVTVAVLDWMFDISSDASHKYLDPVSLIPGQPVGEFEPWHGEWMAEIIHEIAPDAKIIPIRARPKSEANDTVLIEQPYERYLIEGIKYAADHGAAAVSSSMGPLKVSDALNEAVMYAANRGTVFIDVHPEYLRMENGRFIFADSVYLNPLIIHAGIVSVPAHPRDPDPLRDVCTWPYQNDPVFRDGWGYSNGPPIVAGVMALMKSVDPALTVVELKKILIETARMIDGFRVLDAEAALAGVLQLKR